MIDAETYLSRLITSLQREYGSRLVYVGLQGSYLRGEATDDSDIDIMTVIDRLTVSDLDSYRRIISSLEEPEKSCGFICSRTDLAKTKAQLLPLLSGKDRKVLNTCMQMNLGKTYDFEESFDLLFSWCQDTLKSL